MIAREYVPLFIGLLIMGLSFGFYWLYRLEHGKSRNGRWTGFGSWFEFGSFFREVYRLVINNRWLFLFPLGFLLINSLVSLGILSFTIFRFSGARSIQGLLGWHLFTRAQALSCLKQALFSLDYYFSGIFSGYGVMIIALICLCGYPLLLDKMREYRIHRLGSLIRTFRMMLRLALVLLIPYLILLFFWRDKLVTLGLGLVVIMPALQVLMIYFISLIESGYLVAIRRVVNNQGLSCREIFDEALKHLKPLFGLNLILALPGFLGQIASTIYTIRQYLPDQRGSVPFAAALTMTAHYLNLIFAVTLWITPILLVINGSRTLESLRDNFRFIKNNPTRYLIFMSSGILFFFIFKYGNLLLNEVSSGVHYWRWFGGTVFSIITLCGGVVYSIGLFQWVARMEAEREGEKES